MIAGTLALVTVLCIGWIPDFRYMNLRDYPPLWAPYANNYLQTCRHSKFLLYEDDYDNHTVLVIPCSRIRGLAA